MGMYKQPAVLWQVGTRWNANKWLVHWIIIILQGSIVVKCSAKVGLSLVAVHTSLMRRSWMMVPISQKFGQMPRHAILKQHALRHQKMMVFIQLPNVAESPKSK